MNDKQAQLDKISDALQLLDEAAHEEKDDIQNMLKDRYTHLKEAIFNAQESAGETLSRVRDKAVAGSLRAQRYSIDKAKSIDLHVHQNPWAYVGGAAIFGLLTGYILGRNANR